MDVIILERKQYSVAALGGSAGGKAVSSPVLEDMGRLGVLARFRSLFEQYAEFGKGGLTSDQFHLADEKNDIWRFKKGNLRVYCCKDPDDKSLVLLTHVARKKGQKTSKTDVNQAASLRSKYITEKGNENLQTKLYVEYLNESNNGATGDE